MGEFEPVNWQIYHPAPIIGVDEVGRGCLAGPVVAGAVILSRPDNGIFFDSKTLTESRREEVFEIIKREHTWAIGFASVLEIEKYNIFRASYLAMRRSVQALGVKAGHVMIDGPFPIPRLKSFSQTPVIKGDSRVEPISAASIVAKVVRDRWMKEIAEKFPGYGFEVHKGYGTPKHRERLESLGPCAQHRRGFNGVEHEIDAF